MLCFLPPERERGRLERGRLLASLASGVTWSLHHGLHVLLLQLLDAVGFGFAVLLQAANFVRVLVVEKFQVGGFVVQFPDLALQLWKERVYRSRCDRGGG